MFPSPTLLLSSCRSVGSLPRCSVGITNRDTFMGSITGAPLCHTASRQYGLSTLRGAALIHQTCSLHAHVSNRRPSSSAGGSGAADCHALSKRARGRVHGQCNTPHQRPEVLCNKNRFGIDQGESPQPEYPSAGVSPLKGPEPWRQRISEVEVDSWG